MSAAPTAATSAAPPLRWSEVDGGISVATRAGEFAGYIDRRGIDAYAVFDHHSRWLGTSGTREQARAALAERSSPRPSPSWLATVSFIGSRTAPSS